MTASLLIEQQRPLDEGLFAEFAAMQAGLGLPAYRALTLPGDVKATLMDDFLNDPASDPDLRPFHADEASLERDERTLLNFGAALGRQWSADPTIHNVYRWRINEMIAERRLVAAARGGDKRRFAAYNQFIYGGPNRAITAAVIDWVGSMAQGGLTSDSADVREAAEGVLRTLPNVRGDKSVLVPDEATFREVRRRQYAADGYYTLALAGIELPDVGPVKPDTGEDFIRTALQNVGAGHYARTVGKNSSWNAYNADERLEGPADYAMPVPRFSGLILGHELSHIVAAVNGGRSALRLLGVGLDRSEHGDEGRALLREQIVYDSFEAFARLPRWQVILKRQLAISLGAGVLGEEQRFSQVFRQLNAIEQLQQRSKTPGEPEKADLTAQTATWNLLTRVLKGTDGSGGAFYKDKAYLEGNVDCWQLAKTHSELISLGDRGIFDVTNPRHVATVRAAGVLPK